MGEDEFFALSLPCLYVLYMEFRARELRRAQGPATVAWIVAEVNRNPEKRSQQFSVSDFIPEWLLPPKPLVSVEQQREQIREAMRMIAAAMKRQKEDLSEDAGHDER